MDVARRHAARQIEHVDGIGHRLRAHIHDDFAVAEGARVDAVRDAGGLTCAAQVCGQREALRCGRGRGEDDQRRAGSQSPDHS